MELCEHCQRLEAENHHLKNQLARKNRDIKTHKQEYASLLSKYKALTANKKPKYNNGRRNK